MKLFACAAVGVLLSACSTISFYTQAATGQLSLLLGREPISDVIATGDADPQLVHKLTVISEAREFAAMQLGLPDNGSYTTFVDVDRPHLVWNVFAAPPFALTPLQWCFPIAGCVTYRGYFSPGGAQEFADRLRARGLDVYVGGVDAYSTLGWFDDPVPSTVMRRSDHQLAGLIFHELAHQLIYVPGDTTFNESFASVVEQIGLERWLAEQHDQSRFAAYLQERDEQRAFTEFVLQWRQRFADLYQQADVDVADKLALQQQMRDSWHEAGISGRYDGWFAGPLNNAQLLTVATYFDWVPAFEALYLKTEGDLQSFYDAVAALASLPAQARQQQLADLAAEVK